MPKLFVSRFLVVALLAISSFVSAKDDRWTTNHLAGTGLPPLPYQLEPFLPDLKHSKPVDLEFVPKSDEILVIEVDGKLWALTEKSSERRLVADFQVMKPDGENPLGSTRIYNFTFSPTFPADPRGWLVMSHRDGPTGEDIVIQITADLDEKGSLKIGPTSKVEILRWASKGHDGSDLKFSPKDGYLYISTGDGESPGDPANVGQKTDNLLGSILRIDVSDPKNPKQIPADNPFLKNADVSDEVWAYGLRNPWRMSFHPETHQLFVGDNGDESWELVRRVTRGTNHGWSTFEGSAPFRLTTPLGGPTKTLTTPVMEHNHTDMRSVIGGFFYRGKALPELVGQYIYGCYFTGKIWAFEWDGNKATNARRIADAGGPLVSFSENRDHELIIINHNGPISRLIKNENPPASKPIPETLSATGLFSKTADLTPATGVLPYEIAAPAWQDGAEVTRHFSVIESPDKPINIRGAERMNKSWQFPNGSAFAQTLAFDGKRTETRVIHKDGGEWKFLTYHWRADQTDANLVPPEGFTIQQGQKRAGPRSEDGRNRPSQDVTVTNIEGTFDEPAGSDRNVELKGPSFHRLPSRAECTACHTQRSFFLLGFSTEQLNIPVIRDGKSINQIDWLIAARPEWFALNQVNEKWERAAALPNPHDEAVDLDARARTYLHMNCAHCHRESGLGGRAQFQLLKKLALRETGTLNTRPLVGLPGAEETRVIKPGDPDHSAIFRRMNVRGAGQMPLLDSMHKDEAGLKLIRDWISGMKK